MLETSAADFPGSNVSAPAPDRRSQPDHEASVRRTIPATFAVDPQAVTSALLGAVLTLVVLDAVLNVAEFSFGDGSLFGLIPLLDLNRERNFPTWFASMQLALAAMLLANAARTARARGDRWANRWALLSFGFCVLSLDEFMALHERLNPVMRQYVGNVGGLGFPWIVVGIPVVIAAVFTFSGLLRALPLETRRRVLLAGGLYVSGALGVEAVGGAIYQSSYGGGLLYAMTTTLEEGLELVGVTLFIAALLGLLREQSARSGHADHR